MKQENFNITHDLPEKYHSGQATGLRKHRILIAPLDWGLGHATRCIPVIYELIKQGCEVWLAGEGAQKALLQQEFPELPFLSLPGYRVKYGRSGAGMAWRILFQTPRITRVIKDENKWLKEMIRKYSFDAVISDNRYGLYHDSVPCVIIIHQLQIRTNLGKWSEKFLRERNYKYINRFSECWVPDEQGANNLAGELSHPAKKPNTEVHYIGLLSRFTKIDAEEKAGHLLIVLSGPEPQRTIFENKIVNDIAHYEGSATIVRGLPGSLTLIPSTNTLRFYNHLPAEELNKEMNMAEYTISRSGYSTIMDIQKLRKKSILVPTPGQTEQEYLASCLAEKKLSLTFPQSKFFLFSALQQAKIFPYKVAANNEESVLPATIARFVLTLKKD